MLQGRLYDLHPGHRTAECHVPTNRPEWALMSDLGSSTAATQFESTDAATAHVDLYGTSHHLRWPRHATLVDTLIAAGLDVPYSCREGHCGSCVATVVGGEVDMATCDILEPGDLADGLILSCQARPVSDNIHIEF
ncbi:ferredoxin [Mycolicibacterium rhodesiae JS60]|nr:ferredoxin [Mycolicibacterium rhodesiae JS60]